MSTKVGDAQSQQLLAQFKAAPVPSRSYDKLDKSVQQLISLIAVKADMSAEGLAFWIDKGLEMAEAAEDETEQDRDRAFVLLCSWAHLKKPRVDQAIRRLNVFSVVDDYTRAIAADPTNAQNYERRGYFYTQLGKSAEAQADAAQAALLETENAGKPAAKSAQGSKGSWLSKIFGKRGS